MEKLHPRHNELAVFISLICCCKGTQTCSLQTAVRHGFQLYINWSQNAKWLSRFVALMSEARVPCHCRGGSNKSMYLTYQQDTQGFSVAKWTTAKQIRGPHKCDLCGQTFRSESGLKRHKNYHTDNFKCQVCEKRFGDSFDLKRHVSKVHEVDIYKFSRYKCNACSSFFSSLNELKQHMLQC